jgi:uncharacterized membrane protein HdeD (DUF308 family)
MHKTLGVLLGVAMLGIGLVIIFVPDHGLNLIAWLLGVILVVGGVVRVLVGLGASSSEVESRWGAIIAGGLMIVVGIIVIATLRDSLDVLTWFVGALWIVVGIVEFIAVFRAGDSDVRGVGLAMASITVVFGIVLVAWPDKTNDFLLIVMGIYLALAGVMQIASALRKPAPSPVA